MTGLIKRPAARDAATALPTRLAQIVPRSAPVPDPRIAELEAEVERLHDALTEQRSEATKAIEAARKAGRGEAQSSEDDRVAAVELGIADAFEAWDKRLEATDRLAVMLARTALTRVFGDQADTGAQVERTIAHHLGRLDEQAVVGFRVSHKDFGEDAIDALAQRIGQPRARVSADPNLASGACRIDLRLGAIDVDPLKQWAIIDRALAAMEAEA